MANPTTNLGITLPTVGGSSNAWGTILNAAFQSLDDIFVAGGTAIAVNIDNGSIDSTVIGATTASSATFTSVTIGSSAASAGALRLANTAAVAFRNAAGSADVDAVTVDGSNVVKVGSDSDAASVQLGLAAVPTTITGNATLSANLIHSGTTASVGFFGATPVGKQTVPDPYNRTTVSGTGDDTNINTNFTAIEASIDAFRAALVSYGLM